MKKFLIICIGILLILTTSCTMGEDGETYLAYSWTSRPLMWHDENPSIPGTIYNGTYYATNEGTYYMEYTAWNNSSWWVYYTITANPGQLFTNGDPAYFEIALYSFGPSLYKWSYARGIGPFPDVEGSEVEDDTFPIEASNQGQLRRTMLHHGFETMTVGNTTIELEFGLLEPVTD